MLLFETQIPQLEQKKKNMDGSFANVIQEVIDRIAGGPRKENKQPYFMKPSNEGPGKNAPAGSSPDLERATAKLEELRSRDKRGVVDDFLTRVAEKAEIRAGPAPKGSLRASIEHEKKIQGFMIGQMSEKRLKSLEDEIDRA